MLYERRKGQLVKCDWCRNHSVLLAMRHNGLHIN